MFAIGLFRKDDSSTTFLLAKRFRTVANRPAEDVVTEQNHRAVASHELFGKAERFGDAPRLVLVRVEKPVDAKLLPVAEQAQELSCVRAPRDQHHLGYAGHHERFDRVADHRPVVDRQQVLVGDPCKRVEAAAGSARQDDPFHC